MRLLGISGSRRAGSHNTALLRAAGEHLAPPARLELLTGIGDLPAYNEDRDTDIPPRQGTYAALGRCLAARPAHE